MNTNDISQDTEMYSLEAISNIQAEEITFYAHDNFNGNEVSIALSVKEIEIALRMYYADKDNGVN